MDDGANLNCTHGWSLLLLEVDLILYNSDVAADGYLT